MKYEYEDEREAGATTKITYLLGGIGIGAILALLFAPKSGQELRGDIADVTRKGVEKGKETAALVGEKAGDYYEVSREKATEFYQTAQDKAGELKDKAGELAGKAGGLTEKAKDAVSTTKNPFSAAIEAGKEAYQDEKRRTEPNVIAEGRPSYPIKDNKDIILEIPGDAKKEE